MSPSFSKVLADFGRQFLWSPLNLTIKYKDTNSFEERRVQTDCIKSVFYCEDGNCHNSGLSDHFLSKSNQKPRSNTNCSLNSDLCYNNNYRLSFSERLTDITFVENNINNGFDINNTNLKQIRRSLSEPNLLRIRSDIYLIGNDKCISVEEKEKVIRKQTKNNNRSDRKILSFDRNENQYKCFVENNDLYENSVKTNNINTIYVDNYLINQNDNKQTTNCLNVCQLSQTLDSMQTSNESLIKNVSQRKTNFHTTNQMTEESDSSIECEKIQTNFNKNEIQEFSESSIKSNETVVLNEYFDNICNKNHNNSEQQNQSKVKNRLSLNINPTLLSLNDPNDKVYNNPQNLSHPPLYTSDNRPKNSVLDKIKRIGRSQSQGRSDTSVATAMSSRQFVFRPKSLYKNVKRHFSMSSPTILSPSKEGEVFLSKSCHSSLIADKICENESNADVINLENSGQTVPDSDKQIDTNDTNISSNVVLRRSSSYESIEDSGCGSSIQTSALSTDSNRSSFCTGDDSNGFHSSALLKGPFIGYAEAITDCTPCPYFKNALSFKKGDIISIISKDESGTWIGTNNGKIGHFKFVNVRQIDNKDTKRSKILNQNIPSNIQKEVKNKNFHTNSELDSDSQLIYKELKSLINNFYRNHKNLTLNDLKVIINLSDFDLNQLMINGFNDLNQFSKIKETIKFIDCGITDPIVQNRLLIMARILREIYFSERKKSLIREQTIDLHKTSEYQNKYLTTNPNIRTISLPNTPINTPNIDFISNDFTNLLIKLETLNTTSLENSDSSGEYSHQSIDSNSYTIDKMIDKQDDQDHDDYVLYANTTTNINKNDRTVCFDEQQNCSEKVSEPSKKKKSYDSKDEKSDSISPKENSHQISDDKSFDRNLSKKIPLKKIYRPSNRAKKLLSNVSPTKLISSSKGMISSQSVVDLRTADDYLLDSNNSRTIFRRNQKLKKFISSSKRFSSFQSHSSLMSLADKKCINNDLDTTKLCSNSLINAIDFKLKSENIDLTSEPYSDSAGFCGIPPALIQRYTDECQRDTYEVAEALDSIRMKSLVCKGRRGIPNDYLGDSCIGPAIDVANYESLHHWLISLGLPMYENCLKLNGFVNLYKVSKLREIDIINKCGVRDKRHIRILTNAVGALHLSFGDIDKKHFD